MGREIGYGKENGKENGEENRVTATHSNSRFMVTLKLGCSHQIRPINGEIILHNAFDLLGKGGKSKPGHVRVDSLPLEESRHVAVPKGRSVSTGPRDVKAINSVSTITTSRKDPFYSFFRRASERRDFHNEYEKAPLKPPSQLSESEITKPKGPIHPFFLKKPKNPSSEGSMTEADEPKMSLDPPIRPHSALPFRSLESSHLKSVSLPVPLSTCHCRGTLPLISCLPLHFDKRKRKRKDITIDQSESVLKLPNMLKSNQCIQKPKRLVVHPRQVIQLASSINPQNTEPLSYLINTCPFPKAFDMLEYEQTTWCMKYAPPSSSAVITGEGNATNVASWLEKKIERLKHFKLDLEKQKRKKKPLDDFIVDEDEDVLDDKEGRLSKFLILYGPPGIGKTCSVYAAGKELGAYVFEINPGQRRGAKELLSILEGIGQSHLVHSGDVKKNESIVLIEEVDILFEEDSSFWTGLVKFASTSKRPIVLTCTSPTLLPSQIIDEGVASFLHFTHTDREIMTDALCLIALNEGHILDKSVLEIFVEQHNYDMRSCITNLQFWCQMGIGGRKSGVDWFLTPEEAQDSSRVFSEGTFIGVQTAEKEPDREMGLDLGMLCYRMDVNCSADIIQCQAKSLFRESCFAVGDQVLGLPTTSEITFDRHPYDYELTIHDEIVKRNKYHSAMPRIPTVEPMDPAVLREAFSVLSFRQSSSAASTTCHNSIECTGDIVLAAEIAPYIREMVRSDLEIIKSEELLRQGAGDGHRVTRRSCRALGGSGARRYLDGDPEEMLNTGSDKWAVDDMETD